MSRKSMACLCVILVLICCAGAFLTRSLAFQVGRTPSPLPGTQKSAKPGVDSGKWEYRVFYAYPNGQGRFVIGRNNQAIDLEDEIHSYSNQGFEVVEFKPLEIRNLIEPNNGLSRETETNGAVAVLMRRIKP